MHRTHSKCTDPNAGSDVHPVGRIKPHFIGVVFLMSRRNGPWDLPED